MYSPSRMKYISLSHHIIILKTYHDKLTDLDVPTLTSSPSGQVSSGTDIILTCIVSAQPPASLTLYSGDGSEVSSVQGEDRLEHILTSPDCVQTGTYKCMADNVKSTTEESTTLIDVTCKFLYTEIILNSLY